MATEWATYVITAVRFNAAGTHIEEVQVYEYDAENNKLVNMIVKSRSSIVTSIESGYTFCTATKSSDGTYSNGAEVEVVTIDDEKFIKTKADKSKRDNLDNLPIF
jgi:hypothetical protein